MTTALLKAESVLRDRVEELEKEKAELLGAIDALAKRRERATPNGAASGRSKGKSQPMKGPRRVPREEREAQLIARASESPDSTNVALAEDLGVTPAYISMLLKGLTKSGQLRRENGKLVLSRPGTS